MNNLTDSQRDLLRWFVAEIRANKMPEEFGIFWAADGNGHLHWENSKGFHAYEGITRGKLNALAEEQLIRCDVKYSISHSQFGSSVREDRREEDRTISITGSGYKAVDTDFGEPSPLVLNQLTPLADVVGFDPELSTRCLPVLSAGPADPKVWDSVVRTAGVVLEERLRSVGQIVDGSVGRDLVNKVFGKAGTLSSAFDSESEREGYRDLFAGVVGAFRNASAHRLIDPNPQEGGAYITFVNLLLNRLQNFDQSGFKNKASTTEHGAVTRE